MAGCRRKFDLVSQQDDCCSDRFLSELRNLYGNYYFGQFSADHLRGQRGCQVLSRLFQEHQRLSPIPVTRIFGSTCPMWFCFWSFLWSVCFEPMWNVDHTCGTNGISSISLRFSPAGLVWQPPMRAYPSRCCGALPRSWCNLMYLRHVC